MPLYGYKRQNQIATVVGAALNKDALNAFHAAVVVTQTEGEHLFTDVYETDCMMHLTDDEFIPFPASVLVFEHADAAQQDAFITKHDILIGTHQRAIDRCHDMVNYDAPDPWLNVNDNRTIAEINNLTEETDRWDRRSDDEKKADNEMKKMMDELKKKGELSNDDSFSSKQKKGDGKLGISDIRTRVNADGSVDVDNILAHKYGDEQTNAVLRMTFGDKTVSVDVNWDGRDIQGAEKLRDDVFFSNAYRDEYAAGHEPVFTIRTRDGHHESPAKYQEMVGEIVADLPIDQAPAVAGISEISHHADELTNGDGKLSEDNGESFNAEPALSEDPPSVALDNASKYLFAFQRGDIEDEVLDWGGKCAFAIVEKQYWQDEQCLNDEHVSVAAGGDLALPTHLFEELQEAMFLSKLDQAATRAWLEAAGLTFSKELEDLLDYQ